VRLHFVCGGFISGFKKLVAQNKVAQLAPHLDGVADHEVLFHQGTNNLLIMLKPSVKITLSLVYVA